MKKANQWFFFFKTALLQCYRENLSLEISLWYNQVNLSSLSFSTMRIRRRGYFYSSFLTWTKNTGEDYMFNLLLVVLIIYIKSEHS